MSYFGPIGKADRQATIQSLSVALDAAGQPIETWSNTVTVWARLINQAGSERFTAQQVVGRNVTTFRIRFREGLDVKRNRLLYDGLQYDIHAIRELGRREAIELDCSARSET